MTADFQDPVRSLALVEEADRDGVGLADDEEEELRIRISPPRIEAAIRLWRTYNFLCGSASLFQPSRLLYAGNEA
jgi:hypothetical protein